MEKIVHWKDKELIVPELKQSHAKGGRLEKFWAEDKKTGRVFLLKGSSKFNYEPFGEKIAYIIGKNLGMDILEYDIIPAELFQDILPIQSHCKYLSICEKIDRKNYSITSIAEIKRAKNVIRKLEGKDPVTNRQVMYELLPKKYIDTMLLFDAIIGNRDRHYGNVHLLRGINGEMVGAPILDNGASCLTNTSLLITLPLSYKVGEFIDSSSTFADKHIKQMQYADTLNGISFDIPVKTMQILEELEPTLNMMPKYRAELTKKYIVYRLHKYLSLIKNNEIPENLINTVSNLKVQGQEKECT